MLKNAALEIGTAMAFLGQLEASCTTHLSARPDVQIDPTGEFEKQATDILVNLKRACIQSDLDEVLPEIDRFIAALARRPCKYEDARGRAAHLKFRLMDELKNEFYFQVARADVSLYGSKNLFGPEVATKFKDAVYDIENAGNCIALGQPTACVLHLMRAMETALRGLGKRLRVTIDPKATLGKILNDIDPKIKAMPEKTEHQKRKRERWAEARSNLFHVKQAWRDNSMHGKQRYSPVHARDIFRAVKVFMAHLATL